MANCCSGQTCYNLVTIGDIESMVNAASGMNCTNYSSSTNVSYDGCCGSEDYSGYSPSLTELSANTGDVRFQNWSGGTNQFYKDNDGIVVVNPNWGSNACCTGDTNVPLANVNFKYAKFNGFSVNGDITSDACYEETGSSASFRYTTDRHEVSGCTLQDGVVETEVVSNNTYTTSWGDIISAISINNGSWIDYRSYSTMTEGYITIPKSNIFQPIFKKSIIVSQSGGNCGGITATSSGNSVTVRIMPKFRDCAMTAYSDSYTAEKLSSYNGSFNWSNTETCSGSNISKDGATLNIGGYTNNFIPSSVSVSPSSVASAVFDKGTLKLTVNPNDDPNPRDIQVTVTFDICGTEYSSSCHYCQEPGIEISQVGGNCMTGLANVFPSVIC